LPFSLEGLSSRGEKLKEKKKGDCDGLGRRNLFLPKKPEKRRLRGKRRRQGPPNGALFKKKGEKRCPKRNQLHIIRKGLLTVKGTNIICSGEWSLEKLYL